MQGTRCPFGWELSIGKKLGLIKDAPSLILRAAFGSCLISWIFHLNEVLLFCSFLLPVRIYQLLLLQPPSANLYQQ